MKSSGSEDKTIEGRSTNVERVAQSGSESAESDSPALFAKRRERRSGEPAQRPERVNGEPAEAEPRKEYAPVGATALPERL